MGDVSLVDVQVPFVGVAGEFLPHPREEQLVLDSLEATQVEIDHVGYCFLERVRRLVDLRYDRWIVESADNEFSQPFGVSCEGQRVPSPSLDVEPVRALSTAAALVVVVIGFLGGRDEVGDDGIGR